MWNSRRPFGLVALLTLCTFPRLLAAWTRIYPTYDGAIYLHQAQVLLRDHELRFGPFPPGWPTLVGVASMLVGARSPLTLLHTASLLNAVLAGVLLYLSFVLLSKRHTIALSTTLIAALACMPLLYAASTSDLSDLASLVLLLLGVLLFDRRSLIAGIAFGAAYWVRPEAALMALALALSALRSAQRRKLGSFALGFVLAVLPHQLLGQIATGSLFANSKRAWVENALFARDLRSTARLYLDHSIDLLRLSFWAFGPVALGLAAVGVGRCRPVSWCLATPLLVLPLFEFAMAPRYLLLALPLLCELVAEGWRHFAEHTPIVRRRWLAGLMVASCIGFWLAAWPRHDINAERFPTLREAGAWLTSQAAPNTIVADRKPYAAFWAGMEFRRVPESPNLPEFRRWLLAVGAQYLVVHQGIAGGMSPLLAQFLGELPIEFRDILTLEEVFVVEGVPLESTLVYRVRAPK